MFNAQGYLSFHKVNVESQKRWQESFNSPHIFHLMAHGNKDMVLYEIVRLTQSNPAGHLNSIKNSAYKNDTLLHQAARVGSKKLVATLLILGADVSAKNDDGLTPSDVICTRMPRHKISEDKIKELHAAGGESLVKEFSGNNKDDLQESPAYQPSTTFDLYTKYNSNKVQDSFTISSYVACQSPEHFDRYVNIKAIFDAADKSH